MIRLFHVYFPGRTLLLAVSEALLIALALLAATFAEFGSDIGLALAYEYGLFKILVAAFVCMLCMHYYDLYNSLILHNPGQVLTRLVQVLGTACLILPFIYYVAPVMRLGRDLLLIWIVLAGIALVCWRSLFFAWSRSTRLTERVLFLGDGPLAGEMVREIETHPEFGLRLAGYVEHSGAAPGAVDGLRRLGAIEDLPELIERESVDRVVVTMGDRRGKLPVDALLQLKSQGIRIEDANELYEAMSGKVPLASLRPSWLLFSDGFQVSRAMLLYKRTASIILSVLGLVLSLPFMALIALAIRLDSAGPVIFRQKRVGKDGRIFTVFKFRTMFDRPDDNETPASEDDERCTRVGRWLRRARVDELPQLYNILRGDMYFIGPRPFALGMEQELARKIPFYSKRWAVKPGATGWAQVRRGYCATLEDNTEKLSYDLFYIKNLSVGLDFVILFETLKILLLGRGGR